MSKAQVREEKDYSNKVIDADSLLFLADKFQKLYDRMEKVFNDEELRAQSNGGLYKYKKDCSKLIYEIVYKNYSSMKCENYEQFYQAVKDNKLKSVATLNFVLIINYNRGHSNKFEKINNEFCIIFNPFDVKSRRISTDYDKNMDQIAQIINMELEKFTTADSIFI